MELEEALAQIGGKIRDLAPTIETEEATKNAFVMPFISQALGYDVFNPKEVVPEFTADVGVKRHEKVDYALVRDGEVQILIECKKVGAALSLENASQLYRYFSCTRARVGALTNGQVWNFYMDIDEPNRMDSKPFLVLDLLDVDESVLPALRKLTKPAFDIDGVASAAEELKYVGALKRAVSDEFREPSDAFVRLLAGSVYDGAFRASVIEKFRALTAKALKQFLSEQVDARLKTALGAEDPSMGHVATEGEERPGEAAEEPSGEETVTTEEEMAGYRIIKAIACRYVDPARVTMRDAKSYCAIFLDDNNRRPVARLYFNTSQKYLGLFDEEKNREKVPIDSLDEIYRYSDRIIQSIKLLEGIE